MVGYYFLVEFFERKYRLQFEIATNMSELFQLCYESRQEQYCHVLFMSNSIPLAKEASASQL
jgi:hypothetical protein